MRIKDNSKLSPRLKLAINRFITWFEDNMGNETYLDVDVDGKEVHIDYLDLPEYTNLLDVLRDMKEIRSDYEN